VALIRNVSRSEATVPPTPNAGQTFVLFAALGPDLVPPRIWLHRLGFMIPSSAATRWLLLTDIACLVILGRATGWPRVGVPVVLGVGFVALNLVSMAVTDFYLGLALFHLAVAVAAVVGLRSARWLGMAQVALAVTLGIVT